MSISLNPRRWERRHVETAIILKVVLSVTFAAIYFLPEHIAACVGCGSNLLWLWKL